MNTTSSDWPVVNTEHGLLVAFGEFLQQHQLVEHLMQVPVKQKTRTYAPQTKLVELLVGIMSGIEHLADLNDGPHPLATDSVVARAWGQPGFAHYGNVSRTLELCDAQTVAAVDQAIREFSAPFIEHAVHELLQRGKPIIYDLDLMGQPVSATSQTYSGVAFGWMNDRVKLGYQLARVCLSPQGRDRIWLAGFHHPGDTVSVTCLKDLIRAAEFQTGIRPRRRPELLQIRIARQQEGLTQTQRWLAQQQQKRQRIQQTHTDLIGKIYHTQALLPDTLSAWKSAYFRHQLTSWQRRLPRLEAQQATCQNLIATYQARLTEQQTLLSDLQAWRAQLEQENRLNPDPPAYCEARMDSGFTSGENLTWLLEMGYYPNTKAPNDQTTTALRARLTSRSRWVRVGENAEMIAWDAYVLHGCPYPLTAALERFKTGRHYKYATLIHYPDDDPFSSLPAWFDHYNERQTIEAGNKEMKGTFFVQHLMSRSLAGIQLQGLFTGLAANIVRWCPPWLQSCAPSASPKFRRMLTSPKHLVHMAANTEALVQQAPYGTTLQFAPSSPLAGLILFLKGVPAFQLPLGFNRPLKNESK